MALQRIGVHPIYVAIDHRELLPHVFTLTLEKAVVFCCTTHKLSPICAFHRMLLYAVRTFLGLTPDSSILLLLRKNKKKTFIFAPI